ncbi:MAG: Gldg family protein [Anaerolineales bacterium]|nr:MAG: Gldg family protein [Anaerolineales bacterium]
MKKKNTQPAWRNYTFVALIVALLACISTALLGAAKGVIALGLYTAESPERLTNALWVSLGLLIIGLAVYAFLEPAKVQRFLTGRQAKYGGNTLIAVIAFTLTLVIVNFLAFDNPTQVADLTEEQANTLAPEMVTALEKLPEKVTATAFFTQNRSRESAEQLFGNIKANSKDKFDYEFVDPNRDPQRAREAGITGDGKVLLQMGDRSEIAASATESEILKALIRLINPEDRVVYFLTGHGERDPEQINEDNTALTRAGTTLKSKNYGVKSLSLLAENKIPEDADVIIIAGPQRPISEKEVELLRGFLNGGGALVVMEDPTILTNFGDAADPLAAMLTEDWGITLNNDFIIDLESSDPRLSIGFAESYDTSHPITSQISNLDSFFPLTRSLTLDFSKQGVELSQLVSTTDRSWGEKNFDSLTEAGWPPSYDEATETLGPLALAAASENLTTGGRVVVFGTSQFASDQVFDSGYGNSDLFINSVDWAAEQDAIGITPKQPVSRVFQPASQLRMLMLMLIVGLVMPGIFIALGIVTWLQRRRQG